MLEALTWYEDGQNPFYEEGVFLQPGEGNNAFSLDRKPDRPPLRVTPLRIGHRDDLCLSGTTAFQDFDADEWVECAGLESAVLSREGGIPCYVFDNHNHAFYAWAEALKAGWISRGWTLVHMDAHYDDALPQQGFSGDLNDLEQVWCYTNHQLQIATFIQPALDQGLFSSVINVVESPEFEAFRLPNTPVVLDLDLDVFCHEMSHISWRQKCSLLRKMLPQVRLITVATSPFFIDQRRALDVWSRLCDELF